MTYCILRNNDFFIVSNWSSSWRSKLESDEPVASWVLPCLCVRCVVDDHSAVTLCQAGPEFICQLPWRNIPELWRVKVWHEILPRLFCSGVASGLVGPLQNLRQQDVVCMYSDNSRDYNDSINLFKFKTNKKNHFEKNRFMPIYITYDSSIKLSDDLVLF